MKKYYLSSLLICFVFVIILCNGCATHKVWKLGKYTSSQAPERAVILHDGRVVVDFSDMRKHKNGLRKNYYKRVYFGSDAFDYTNERAGTSIKNLEGTLESRIARYIESVNPDNVKGNWALLSLQQYELRLPPIQEQDLKNVCMKVHNYVNCRDYCQSSGSQNFDICNEEKKTVVTTVVKFGYEDKREWWFYPAQLLYIPAVVFDVITSPIQLAIFIYAINHFSMSH